MKKVKVIIDTNLWISFLITHKLNSLDKLFSADKLQLLFSEELLEEFLDVANRPKFKKYFTKDDITHIIKFLNENAELIKVTSDVKICRDENDNFLLNLALDSKADYLITGDKDLLILGSIKETIILTFQDFLKTIT